jgi:dTDP-4-dehydrorhamnose 3,5-epimerase-like enzyme
MKVKNCKQIDLKFVNDGIDGNLVVAEGARHIPFEIKRVYFINNLSNKAATRGKHAHKKLEQVLFCLNGSFDLTVEDGERRETIRMVAETQSHAGFYMGPSVWHTMSGFSPECVILVFASDYYDESDYIRDHAAFLEFVKGARR